MRTPVSKPTVLIVARDSALRSELSAQLTADFRVDEAEDGLDCLHRLTEVPPRLIILDTRTAGLNGWKALQRVRLTAPVPVILLVNSPGDRTRGLQLGADDAVARPVDGREVAARAIAVLRRYGVVTLRNADARQEYLSFDPAAQSVKYKGRTIDLSQYQYGVLAMLAAHPGQVMARQVIWDRVWGPDVVGDLRIIDRHVMHLRRKLGDHHGVMIANVWGIGYRFAPAPAGEGS